MRNYEFGIRNYYKLPELPIFTFLIYKIALKGTEKTVPNGKNQIHGAKPTMHYALRIKLIPNS